MHYKKCPVVNKNLSDMQRNKTSIMIKLQIIEMDCQWACMLNLADKEYKAAIINML